MSNGPLFHSLFSGPNFTIRNTSTRALNIFNMKIGSGREYNLLHIPNISEDDIKSSLLKGQLKSLLEQNQISIIDSTINLVQSDPSFSEFLENAGVTTGIKNLGAPGVANLAALQNIDDSYLSNGTLVSVASVMDQFVLDKDSELDEDDIKILTTRSGTGRWLRKCQPNEKWLSQGNWVINADTGNDENIGDTSERALKTFNEFLRRTNDAPIQQATYVSLETDINEDSYYIRPHIPEGTFLEIDGVTTTIFTGTVTATQAYNSSTGLDGYIVDSSIPTSWTASGLVGKLVELTSGPNIGASAWIIKDLGSKTARVSPFFNGNTYGTVHPTIGTTYKVVDIPIITGICNIEAKGYGAFFFAWTDLYVNPAEFHDSISVRSGFFGLWFAKVRGLAARAGTGSKETQAFGTMFATDGGTFQVENTTLYLSNCVIGSSVRTAHPGAWIIVANSVIQGGLGTSANLDNREGGMIAVNTNYYLAAFDGTGSAIIVNRGGTLTLTGKIFGKGWATGGKGIWVSGGSKIMYTSGNNFTAHADIQGPTIQVQYGGTNADYSAVGTAGVVNLSNYAMIIPTGFTP